MKMRTISVKQAKLKTKGDVCEGTLVSKSVQQYSKGPALEVVLKNTEGLVSCILGKSGEKAMSAVAEGEYCRITFTGQEKTLSGNLVNTYKVEVAEAEG